MATALRKAAALLAVGFGAVIFSIVLPTVVITQFAVRSRDAAEIGDYAVRTAEPWALAGAVLATFCLTLLFARRRRRWLRSGITFGATAAAFVTAAAWRASDIDLWTAGAWVALPLAGMFGAWWARYREEDRPPELIAAPAPAPVASARVREPGWFEQT